MAAHSNILAWDIPWTKESGGLQSVGSHRVGHNWQLGTWTNTTKKERKSSQPKWVATYAVQMKVTVVFYKMLKTVKCFWNKNRNFCRIFAMD